MVVEVDDSSGFCFGVVNAISKAEEYIAATRGSSSNHLSPSCRRLVSLGDIVHNGAEMARLEALGLEIAPEDTDLADLAGRTVLIRAHGEPPETYRQARKHGITLVDATCPVVAALQKTVARAYETMAREGGQVVIFGRRGHAEVRGLTGHTCGDAIVVESEADLDAIDFSRPIYFLAQTTSSLSEFERLGGEIHRRMEVAGADFSHSSDSLPSLRLHDTVCRRVAGREEQLARFARRFDVVVFVAGAKSSNGKVLFEAVRAANTRSYKIENASELRPEWFSRNAVDGGSTLGETPVGTCKMSSEVYEISVGVCGATSTPRWSMNEIAEKIKGYDTVR